MCSIRALDLNYLIQTGIHSDIFVTHSCIIGGIAVAFIPLVHRRLGHHVRYWQMYTLILYFIS